MKKKFLIPSELSRVQKTSEEVLRFLQPLKLNEAVIFDVRLCLEEALVNAIKYGNCQRPDLTVEMDVDYDESALRIQVQDQGAGFEPDKLPDCTQGANKFENHGRGVFLMQQLMDEVKYNEKGNSLLMVKLLRGKKAMTSKEETNGR